MGVGNYRAHRCAKVETQTKKGAETPMNKGTQKNGHSLARGRA